MLIFASNRICFLDNLNPSVATKVKMFFFPEVSKISKTPVKTGLVSSVEAANKVEAKDFKKSTLGKVIEFPPTPCGTEGKSEEFMPAKVDEKFPVVIFRCSLSEL